MKDMQELFLPHELALLAKNHGFNEPCFGSYRIGCPTFFAPFKCDKQSRVTFLAPLYQQIITWLGKEPRCIQMLEQPIKFTDVEPMFVVKPWGKKESSPMSINEALREAFNLL